MNVFKFQRMAITIAALLFVLVPVAASAQPETAPPRPDLANLSSRIPSVDGRGTAAGGYDVVAFFDYGEVTLGSPDFRADHAGFRYNFASKVTLKKFLGDPERYLPAYGGYCALSLGAKEGELAGGLKPGLYKAEPTVYKIVDDRLFFFSSEQARELWSRDEAGYIARADANFAAILASRRR